MLQRAMAAEAEAAREARAKVGQEITKQQLQKKNIIIQKEELTYFCCRLFVLRENRRPASH